MSNKGSPSQAKRTNDHPDEQTRLVHNVSNKNKEYLQIQSLQNHLDTDKTYQILLFSSIFLHITLYLWIFLKNGPQNHDLFTKSANLLVLIAFTMTFYTIGLIALQLKTALLQKTFLFMSFLAIFLNMLTLFQLRTQNVFYVLFVLLLLIQNAVLSFKAYGVYSKFKEIQDLNELYLIVNKPNMLC